LYYEIELVNKLCVKKGLAKGYDNLHLVMVLTLLDSSSQNLEFIPNYYFKHMNDIKNLHLKPRLKNLDSRKLEFKPNAGTNTTKLRFSKFRTHI